jgi:nicotinamidase-related amidase
MTLTTMDTKPALVVIDLQKGVVTRPVVHPVDTCLRDLGVTQIVLAGIATSLGVESTARAAHEHGYHVVLATDAMTDLDAEAHHNSIERIFPRLGETAITTEVLEMLDKTR